MGDCGRMWLKVEGGGRIMFMSEYSHSIDSKGRMILPAKFREELGDHFVLAPGLDSCLCIYPELLDRDLNEEESITDLAESLELPLNF